MSHSSLYLTNLYNDLITNTPQTITMDIPSEVGQGQISQTKIKHGVILSDWKMCYQSDMNVQGPVSGEYMQIIFCLNDGISWGIMNENRSITIQKNESCIYAGHDGTEYICYKKDSNFSFKSIKIPIPYFSQLLADYFDGQEITVYEKKLLNGIAKVSVTPIMEQILSETSKFSQYRGGLGYLYLDGKLLELLSIYLGEVLELDILMGKNISMSRTERTAIMEAKRIIDSQLAFAPSCEELSQQVHLSLTKLTRGFSSFYGMPIHQYVIEQRLTQAAQLLLDGDWNVGEVAAIVGYVQVPVLSVIMSVFGVTLLKLIPIVMMGLWILRTTYMDDLMVALQRMRLPQAVTIPLVVMFRYIPTLRIEYRQIRSTMDIRGISDTLWKRVSHPLATIEYILIPLLMRCLKVTDELAASGTTRGLELECKRYALRPIRFSWPEVLVSLLGVVFLAALLFLDQTRIGEIILWRV